MVVVWEEKQWKSFNKYYESENFYFIDFSFFFIAIYSKFNV